MTSPATPYLDRLHEALDERRQERGLTWQGLVREINAPFQHVPSRPIATSTITGMRARRAVEGDVVLQVLRWLGRSPESLVPDQNGMEAALTALPLIPPTQILRFDTRRLHAALDAHRLALELTWVALAADMEAESPDSLAHIGKDSPTSLRHLAHGGRTGFPHVLRWTRRLGRPVAAFTRGCRQ
jgi:hypothetical protein